MSANKLRFTPKSQSEAKRVEICERALKLAKLAFAPISGFAVGVIIKSVQGDEFTGQNQENSAFDAIHAEMAALANWNAAGEPQMDLIAIAGFRFWPDYDGSAVVTPCGRCRQWLYEATLRSNSKPQILCANGDLSDIKPYQIDYLLPDAFSIAPGTAPYGQWYGAMRRKLLGT